MRTEILKGFLSDTLCDTVIISAYGDSSSLVGQAVEFDRLLNGQISTLLVERPKLGNYGEIAVIYTLGLIPAKRVIVAGLGKIHEVSSDKLRAAMGSIVRLATQHGAKTLALYPSDYPGDIGSVIAACTEGVLLGSYQFNEYKTEKKNENPLEKMIFSVPNDSDTSELVQSMRRAEIIANSVMFTRDLVNHPSSFMTPSRMAWHAYNIASQHGLEAQVFDKAEIEKLNMQSFLAVAQGSQEPLKLIVLKYNGKPDEQDTLGLIGKGITFDSGGISLKPSEGMEEMKTDMAGGAAVLGAMLAIAQLKPKINILAVIPCTENMPSGTSLKPGDVISSMAGKSIEVVNTDAEGRLLLADAVTYARHLGAVKLVDVATLTGACVVALGSLTSGVIDNDDSWCSEVLSAARECGEKMWRLPSFEEYKEQIKSPIADLKNSGGRPAGAITAGLFIAEFAAGTPWVHIDIAGTATTAKDNGYNIKGATGAGVRTLIQLAHRLADHDC